MFYQDPLGIMYLAAVLKQAGHEVHFVDAGLDREWERYALRVSPDIVAYSVITGNQNDLLDINRKLKRRFDFLSIWGGPHPTFFPEFIEEDGVDAICIGEGEGAFVDVANALSRGEDISRIPNLHVKTNAGVVKNIPRPLCQDLDTIPFPDRSILKRYPQYSRISGRAMITSRGCPFSCTFCYNSRYREIYRGTGKYARRRSIENVIEECLEIKKDPWAKQILFKDDLFAQDAGYIRDFARIYPREVGLPFTCNVRADRMTEGIAEDLAKAGARVVHFGVESANERVREEVLGRKISRESMLNTARWLRERGIRVYTFNIVGIPDETPKEAFETLEFNAELGADMSMYTLFQPYPRTPLGDRAAELGWKEDGYGDFSHTYFRNSMRRLPHQRRYRNMVHLFPAASVSPMLRRMAPLLVRLPLTPLYAGFDFIFKALRFIYRLRLVSPGDVAIYSRGWSPRPRH